MILPAMVDRSAAERRVLSTLLRLGLKCFVGRKFEVGFGDVIQLKHPHVDCEDLFRLCNVINDTAATMGRRRALGDQNDDEEIDGLLLALHQLGPNIWPNPNTASTTDTPWLFTQSVGIYARELVFERDNDGLL